MSIDSALSARRLRELFENIPDGVYETSPDGRILAANRALVRMLGYSSEEELRRTGAASLYLDPDQRRATSRILTETGRLVNAELQLRRRDGSILHVLENARAVRDDSGSVICYQGTLTDISDRKRTEEELRKARDAALEASRLKSRFLEEFGVAMASPADEAYWKTAGKEIESSQGDQETRLRVARHDNGRLARLSNDLRPDPA